MPIASSDLHIRLSTTAGSAGDSTAQATPSNSLGKYLSTTDVVDATLNNLFPDVSGTENANSNVDYLCIFIYNAHATITWQNVVVWIDSQVTGGATMAIGLDTTAASAHNSASAQALTIANKNTAPAGVSFSAPTTQATGLSIGNLTAGQCKAVWVQRTAANTVAVNNDGGVVKFAGDTTA